jgi:hypothetical protein
MAADLSDFWAHLWASGASPQCLSCGQTHAGYEARITAIPEVDPMTREYEYDEDSVAVALTCGECGFIRLHKLDLADDSEGKGGNGVGG